MARSQASLLHVPNYLGNIQHTKQMTHRLAAIYPKLLPKSPNIRYFIHRNTYDRQNYDIGQNKLLKPGAEDVRQVSNRAKRK